MTDAVGELLLVTPFMRRGSLQDTIVAAAQHHDPHLHLRQQQHSIAASPWPSPAQWLRLARDACAAVAYLHAHRIVHRDIAPRNLLVGADGRVVLCDFGMSRLLAGSSSSGTRSADSRSTPSSSSTALPSTSAPPPVYHMGSNAAVPIRWAAPETLRDRDFTPASDVWALGVSLWQCAARCAEPYAGHDQLEVAVGVATGALTLLSNPDSKSSEQLHEAAHAIPEPIARWLRECMCANARHRPTAQELLFALDAVETQLALPRISNDIC